ncbi:hypothetical protein EJ05DRAFT_530280 [Pseudovirgaria hyperparasitica]|uniref:BTB domain-containing protein n=1 Tax=Pseudovirgaria hyperparasitica TaxID=470096 RepID=A0A6A6WHR3_9PEZI|nr:uncharacterized protein EJ05DRAFT_530280 [Pseudovirgaria hyperparasitica]KAF2761580.1 hypothetical protein EJ05DRAFT_530280 [Pseudovirgaria hyperparasitica]
MASSFEYFIQSQQFTFYIGREEKPIVVHAAVIAATSQQLNVLINGGMEESEKQSARFKDVRVDDFIRFCEYAYRGDYTVPPCEKIRQEQNSLDGKTQPPDEQPQQEPSSVAIQTQEAREEWPWTADPLASKKKPKGKNRKHANDWGQSIDFDYPSEIPKGEEPPVELPQHEVKPAPRTRLRTQFNSREFLTDNDPKALILKNFEPKSNKAAHENFTPVFLAHARLYWFAHLRLIEPLKALTLRKLHKTLLDFKLYDSRVGDIVELSRYIYSNQDLPGRSEDGTLDELRKLVVEYIVCEIDTIGKNDEFVKYIEEGGEFVGDFWRMTRDYIA